MRNTKKTFFSWFVYLKKTQENTKIKRFTLNSVLNTILQKTVSKLFPNLIFLYTKTNYSLDLNHFFVRANPVAVLYVSVIFGCTSTPPTSRILRSSKVYDTYGLYRVSPPSLDLAICASWTIWCRVPPGAQFGLLTPSGFPREFGGSACEHLAGLQLDPPLDEFPAFFSPSSFEDFASC